MATTRVADTYTNSVAMTVPSCEDVTAVFSYVTGGSLALALNDLLYLVKVPKGAQIVDFALWVPDLDSGTTLTLSLGLVNRAASAASFLNASTVGQAGGLVTPFNNPNGVVSGSVPDTALTADDIVALKAAAAAAGAGAGGTLKGYVRYHMHTSVW